MGREDELQSADQEVINAIMPSRYVQVELLDWHLITFSPHTKNNFTTRVETFTKTAVGYHQLWLSLFISVTYIHSWHHLMPPLISPSVIFVSLD